LMQKKKIVKKENFMENQFSTNCYYYFDFVNENRIINIYSYK